MACMSTCQVYNPCKLKIGSATALPVHPVGLAVTASRECFSSCVRTWIHGTAYGRKWLAQNIAAATLCLLFALPGWPGDITYHVRPCASQLLL